METPTSWFCEAEIFCTFSQCEWGALSPDFLSRLSSSSMPFCPSQLYITTEDACDKLVEKKNIILAYGLGNFSAP